MVRISDSLLPANGSGVPQVELTNTSVNVAGTFFQTTQPVSAAALPLPSGAATESTVASVNSKITACDTGAVVISSGTVSVSGTVSTSSSVAITGTRGNMDSSRSVVTNDVSNSIDVSGKSKFSLYIESSNLQEVQIEISGDGGSNYMYHSSIYLNNGTGFKTFDGDVVSDVRIKYAGSGTADAVSCFMRV